MPRRTPSAAAPADDDGDGLSGGATPAPTWTRPTLPGALDWDWGVQHPTSQAQPQAPRTTTTTTWTRPVRPGSLDWDWDAQGPSQSQSHSQPQTQPQPHVASSPADAAPIMMMPTLMPTLPAQPWITGGGTPQQQQQQAPGTGTTSTSTAAAAAGVGGVGVGVGVSVPGVGWFPFGVPPPQQQPPRPARPVQPAAAVGVGVSVPGVGWFPFGVPPSQPAALLPAIDPPTPPQQQPPRPVRPVQPAWLLRLIAQQRDAQMADAVDTAAVSPATWRPSSSPLSSLWPNIPPQHQEQQPPAAVWIPRLFRWNRGIAAAIMRGDNNSNTPMGDHVVICDSTPRRVWRMIG
ncbi:hypothetical protein Pelo_4684 [Pelomyxa schiedti]|nr:hypothetical protein Pelo_4684 [Pelomyxa schiedti]